MKLLYAILKIGLLIGLLDAIAASVNAYIASGVTPDRVFRFIASGVFGMEAFKGSASMIAWGVLFHFLIALIWTTLFFLAAANFRFVTERYLISGALYGIVVWAVMEYAVVPLSNTPPLKNSVTGMLVMIGIHVVVIGIPLSVMAMRYLTHKQV